MTVSSGDPLFVPVGTHSKLLEVQSKLWQMRLLTSGELADFCRDHGLGMFFWTPVLEWLWDIGLLHADMVLSRRKLSKACLRWVFQREDGVHVYADERSFVFSAARWTRSAKDLVSFEPKRKLSVHLYFHPFRYYVLFHLARWGKTIHSHDMLKNLVGLATHQDKDKYKTMVANFNDVVSLAIAAEPFTYREIYGGFRSIHMRDWNAFSSTLSTYKEQVLPIFRVISRKQIDTLRADICVKAESLDSNDELHTLIRLADADFRFGLKGDIGGATHMKSIAETLRRAYEEAHEIELPEEDERMYATAFSPVLANSKRTLYGSSRLLSDDRSVKNEFLRRIGLDYSIKLRWYVEGPTEQGAIQQMLKGVRGDEARARETGIDVVDLGGLVAQNKGKNLAIQDSLSADQEAGVFSFVSLDKDVQQNISAIRTAIENDLVCGRVFVSDPDMEFGNFDLDEFEEMLWKYAQDNGASSERRNLLKMSLRNIATGKDLESKIASLGRNNSGMPELSGIQKGKAWGELMGQYALDNPKRASTGKERPIVGALRSALQAAQNDYKVTKAMMRLDPDNYETLYIERAYPTGHRSEIRKDVFMTVVFEPFSDHLLWTCTLGNNTEKPLRVRLATENISVTDDVGQPYAIEIVDPYEATKALSKESERTFQIKARPAGVMSMGDRTEYTLSIGQLAGSRTVRIFKHRVK